MPQYTFRLSVEKASKCDPADNDLGHQPIACLSTVLNSAHAPLSGKRGLGEGSEEWWCLKCVESLFEEMHRRWLLAHSDPPISAQHPLQRLANWIIADQRSIPTYIDKYKLIAPYIYALEKWKAVLLYDQYTQLARGQPFNVNAPAHFGSRVAFLGIDRKSFYVDKAMRDLRGVMERGGIAEISAQECRDVALSVVFQRVDAIMAGVYKARAAARKAVEARRKSGKEDEQWVMRHCLKGQKSVFLPV